MKIIDKTFADLHGKLCWGLRYDRQLNLSLNFGQPSLRIREPVKTESRSSVAQRMASTRTVTVSGEWWLWIYVCRWKITRDNERLASSSESLRRIELACKILEGQAIVSTRINPNTGATRFDFDLGCALHCHRFEKETDDELWTLYKPNGYVLNVHGNGTYGHHRSNRNGTAPLPIKDGLKILNDS